jgi:hypothetical protein
MSYADTEISPYEREAHTVVYLCLGRADRDRCRDLHNFALNVFWYRCPLAGGEGGNLLIDQVTCER